MWDKIHDSWYIYTIEIEKENLNLATLYITERLRQGKNTTSPHVCVDVTYGNIAETKVIEELTEDSKYFIDSKHLKKATQLILNHLDMVILKINEIKRQLILEA